MKQINDKLVENIETIFIEKEEMITGAESELSNAEPADVQEKYVQIIPTKLTVLL